MAVLQHVEWLFCVCRMNERKGEIYSMSQKNVSKNVQFRFQKRKLSFNAFAVFSSRSVSFPSINRSVSFRSVLSRSISYYVSG